MATQDVKYIVTVDDGGAIRKFADVDKAIDHLKKVSADGGKAVAGFGKDFLTTLVPAFTAGQLAADGVRKAFSILKQEITETIQAAIESEKVDRALEASLEIMGMAGFNAAEGLRAYASELQRKTIYDDEAIKSSQALFVQLGLTREELNDATRGAIGLASVYQMDLQSATRAVAMGYEGNYRALQQMIPALKGATTESEKHQVMVDFLANSYRRAESEAGTFGGRLDQFKNTWGELQETLGGFITQNESVIDTLSGVKSIIEWLNANAGKISTIKKLDPTNYFGPVSFWKSLASAIGFTGRVLEEDLRNSEAAAYDYNAELGALYDGFLKNQVATIGWQEIIEKHRLRMLQAKDATKEFKTATQDLVEVDVAAWADGQTAHFGELDAMLAGIVAGMTAVNGAAGDFQYQTPAGDTVWYKAWMEKQKAWYAWSKEEARIAEQSAEAIYGKFENFSNEFYQSITGGFARAFEMFRLTTEGFKNFFIATWQAIKNAFFQILADMLAKWLTMAFVKVLLGALTGGSGSFFGTGTAGSIGMQRGFHGVVSQPTLALIGEAGPEAVNVTPLRGSAGYGARTGGGGGSITNIFNIRALDGSDVEYAVRHRIVPVLKEVYAHGGL